MSLARAVLVCVQGVAFHVASTPPNKTPSKARFDTTHPWWIRIARPSIQMHSPLILLCALSELALIVYEQDVLPIPLSLLHFVQHTLCYTSPSPSLIYLTPLATLGVLLTVAGSLLRLTCFHTLGSLFTFDLTILPKHHLVTSGPYAYVRHPAYAGSLTMVAGLALVNLTPGSWVTECGILGSGITGSVLRLLGAAVWIAWWLAVGDLRCRAEDAQLRKTFGHQWDDYASRVNTWYLPGLI